MRKLFQPFIDKYQKWDRDRKYPEGKYFRVAYETKHNGIMPIELLKGPFQGIIYSYGSVTIGEDLGYMGSKAAFDIEIVKGPQNLIEDVKFCKITGDILLTIIEKAVYAQADKFESENLADEEIGENYIEEPVPQRTVRKKDSAIPKKRISSGPKRKKPVRRHTKVRSKVQPDTDV